MLLYEFRRNRFVMQAENVIYFNGHILYADRKEGINTDKKRLSQVQTPQNMRGNALVNSGRIRHIFEKKQMAMGYAGFSDMIGIADFGTSDAAVNHDEAIYALQSKP
ncbi:hypothetical protein C6503_18190 [Candidatus Poribacteria bacterium]|nr:MAG: hypothetical protein C6503_18190 [Candidatus Poribacteria bacterium]